MPESEKLSIALNCLSLDSVRPTGVERFVRNVLSGVRLGNSRIQCYTRNQTKSLDDIFEHEFLALHPNLTQKTCVTRSTSVRILIEMIWLPFRTFNDDVVLSVNNFGPLWGKKRQRRLTIIHDVWFMSDTYEGGLLNKWIFKLLIFIQIRRSSLVITVSNFSRRDISRYFSINESDITVVNNCIGQAVSLLPSQSDSFFLMIGSDRINKNIERAIRGYCAMREQNPEIDISLKLAGKYSDEFVRKIECCSGDYFSSIEVLGFVSDKRLEQLYRSCRGVVFLSLYEGFGIPAIEALLRGKPLLISSGTACAEICGDLAIRVNGEDIESIAIGLLELSTGQVDSESTDFKNFMAEYMYCEKSTNLLQNALLDNRF